MVGVNVQEHKEFHPAVKMWVFEEMVDGRKLTDIINEEHENTKYLPGYKIPENVVCYLRMYRHIHGCTVASIPAPFLTGPETRPGLHCK